MGKISIEEAKEYARQAADLMTVCAKDQNVMRRETVRIRCGGTLLDWEFTDDMLCEMVVLAETDPDAYEVAKLNAGRGILEGNAPELLMLFGVGVLRGLWPKPKPAGRPLALNEHRLSLLAAFVSTLTKKGLPRFRNEATKHRNTACDIMAEALEEAGMYGTSASFLNDLFRKPQYAYLHRYSTK